MDHYTKVSLSPDAAECARLAPKRAVVVRRFQLSIKLDREPSLDAFGLQDKQALLVHEFLLPSISR